MKPARRFPIGAELVPGGAHFRVWAPRRRAVQVVLEKNVSDLSPEGDGYFSGLAPGVKDGDRYRLRLDGGEAFPDPASRFQPEGPLGPSQVVDPDRFPWTDGAWPGLKLEGQVIYEMHIGTFAGEGTFQAAAEQLPTLADDGITAVEVMPVNEFAGRFGWGYDGVDLYAPTRLYGGPDDFRRFVDRAHALGLGVILDVVYNHLGPVGNFLKQFSGAYFTDRYENDWGEAVNFDGEDSGPVREFFFENAAYWIQEYHIDGLRLDATHAIYDTSPTHIVADISRRAREAAGKRPVIVIAENESQQAYMAWPLDKGGYGVDALWNDDFHHAARVALTGHSTGYYSDYRGRPQELISAVKRGYIYQGQCYSWQNKRRGTPALGLKPATFVLCIQNHDQIANSANGQRIHQMTIPGRCRAMTALLLLAPGTPMLFQGQEFAASSPFLYFSDVAPELAPVIREGRARFLSQFPNLAAPEMKDWFTDPASPAAFERCKLAFSERVTHAAVYRMHRDLLRMRREDPVFSRQTGELDGAVLGASAFVLRFFAPEGDRLLLINLAGDLRLDPAPEPLLAPPEGRLWEMMWSSEDPRYGGSGTPPPEGPRNWFLTGESALVMRAAEPHG
ncbi:MAG: malto-oligosyltrehalose trehalohydrolase [Chloroflexi bacterium]|nr:malto-oligosyltrehalose trehalohydrolase [Chloroflexota bacterium]